MCSGRPRRRESHCTRCSCCAAPTSTGWRCSGWYTAWAAAACSAKRWVGAGSRGPGLPAWQVPDRRAGPCRAASTPARRRASGTRQDPRCSRPVTPAGGGCGSPEPPGRAGAGPVPLPSGHAARAAVRAGPPRPARVPGSQGRPPTAGAAPVLPRAVAGRPPAHAGGRRPGRCPERRVGHHAEYRRGKVCAGRSWPAVHCHFSRRSRSAAGGEGVRCATVSSAAPGVRACGSISSRSRCRARESRDITVPTGTSSTFAAAA